MGRRSRFGCFAAIWTLETAVWLPLLLKIGGSGPIAPSNNRVDSAPFGMECRVRRLLKKSTAVKGRIGLAFGPGEVAVAVLRRDSGTPVLERCEILPVDPAGGTGAISAAIRAAGLPRVPVSTVLKPDDYQLALVEAPDVPPAELRAAMRWRLKEAIDFRVEDAIIDVFDVPDQNRGGHGRMMYAVAARRSAVDRYTGALAGVTALDVVDVPELCLRNLAALLPGAAAGVALLYLGETALSIVLVRGRTFYFARHMARETPPRPAGHSGGNPGSLPVPAAPDIESVVLELQRSLDYYERHFDQPPITRIAVSPAGARAAELARELGRETGFEVATLDLNLLLHCATPVAACAQAGCLLAVGAALREEHRSL
jgi:MSHA biogenesis protein MshI